MTTDNQGDAMKAFRLLRLSLVAGVLAAGLVWSSAAMATTYDGYEVDNVAATARTIALGSTQQRSIYPAGDVDWIKFNATAGTMYRLETTRATILPDAFTELELYAPDGTTLLASDYESTGQYWFSRLVWTAPSTGTYYLRVDGPPLMEGNYALRVLDTTGLRYVRGTVTADAGGAPIQGIMVGASTAGGDLLGRSETAADGTYAIPLFYNDAYGISFADPTRTYKDEWYDNAYHPSGLRLVAVGATGVTGIDAGLTPGAVVEGLVTDEGTGLPLSGIRVHLLIDNPYLMSTQYTTTATDGSYRFSGLAARGYSAAFVDPTGRYRTEHHDGIYWSGYFEAGAFNDATWVDLALGETATIDASLLEKPTLSGQVRSNTSGEVLAGQEVTIERLAPAVGTFPIVQTSTDANGQWTAAVDVPGQYGVRIGNLSGPYISEYYDNVYFTDPDSGTPITIGDYGAHLTGLNARLDRAAGVHGRVTRGGIGVPGMSLRVLLKTDAGWRRVEAYGVTQFDGSYQIQGLPPGEQFCIEYADDTTIPKYTGNAPSLDLAGTFQPSLLGPGPRQDVDVLGDPYRAAGSTRFATAVAASRATFPSDRTKTVVIASGTGFADALSASALAGAVDGPVLLASRYDVPGAVLDEIERLGATQAYVVGGTGVLDDFVLRAIYTLPRMAYPTRIAGADRYETSSKVALKVAELDGEVFSHGAFIARGDTYPDALAAGPFAYSQRMPVLLTRPGSLPSSVGLTIETLDITRTVICGDVTAVSSGVENAIEALNSGTTSTVRRGGTTRYDTSAIIARYGIDQGWCPGFYPTFGYATGTNYPDALAGASALGARNGCLMLVTPGFLPGSVREVAAENKWHNPRTFILGDKGVVSDSVLGAIESALYRPPE